MLKSRAGVASALVALAIITVLAGPKHFGSTASWPNSMIGGRFGHEDGGPNHEGALVPISEVWWISALLITVAAVLLLSMLFSRRSAQVGKPIPVWDDIPEEPASDLMQGHPTWWFEDPLTTGRELREPAYPVEKLSVTVSHLKSSVYVLTDKFAIGRSVYPLPFVRYLAGVPVDQLAREFEEHRAFVRPKIRVVGKAWEPWYGSLAVLLSNTDAVTWLFRRKVGQNFMFDSFIGHRPLTPASPYMDTHPSEPIYKRLREAVELQEGGEPKAAAEALYAYVDEDWYDEHHEFSWHGTYDKLSGFIGYWCFEAAAMSVIHGIDDTALRSHRHYPTDLADYGRSSKTEPLRPSSGSGPGYGP